MPRDGSLTLSDVREPTLKIVCAPCSRHGRYNVERRRQADQSFGDPGRLPQGALGQHLRPMQGRVRGALASELNHSSNITGSCSNGVSIDSHSGRESNECERENDGCACEAEVKDAQAERRNDNKPLYPQPSPVFNKWV
jgi:hypothetical protein